MLDFIELILGLVDLVDLLRWWRWMVAMLLGAGAAWLLASAVPSRLTSWVWAPVLLVAFLLGMWWEARSA